MASSAEMERRVQQLVGMRQDIYKYCFALLKSEEAQDAAQETLLRAYSNLETFSGTTEKLKSWTCVIARNLCLNRLRAKKTISYDSEATAYLIDNATPITSPEHQQLEGKLLQSQLVDEIMGRAKTHKPIWDFDDYTIFECFYMAEERTIEEVAKILGKNVNFVKYRLYERIRVTLEQIGKELTKKIMSL